MRPQRLNDLGVIRRHIGLLRPVGLDVVQLGPLHQPPAALDDARFELLRDLPVLNDERSVRQPFIRASQSSDTELMKLLLDRGADPKRKTNNNDTALTLAAGIGWVDGVTYERSAKDNVAAVRMLLDLGLDPNAANNEGRTPLMVAPLTAAPA